MRIIITGGSGFLGRHISERLMDRYGPIAEFIYIARKRKLDFLDKYNGRFKYTITQGDITDLSTIKKLFSFGDIIIHSAGLVEYGWFPAEDYYKINVDGTRNIFELSLKHRVKKVVYLSTAAIYHPTYNIFANEKTELKNNHETYYTRSKYFGYKLVEEYRKKGLNIITLLPTSILGFGAPLFEPFIKQSLNNRVVVLPKKRARLSIVLVQDVAECVSLTIKNNIFNQNYILSDIDMTLKEFAGRVEIISKKKIYKLIFPNNFLKLIFILHYFFTRFLRIKSFNNYELFKIIDGNFLAKSDKAQKELGWKTSDFDKNFSMIINKYIAE